MPKALPVIDMSAPVCCAPAESIAAPSTARSSSRSPESFYGGWITSRATGPSTGSPGTSGW